MKTSENKNSVFTFSILNDYADDFNTSGCEVFESNDYLSIYNYLCDIHEQMFMANSDFENNPYAIIYKNGKPIETYDFCQMYTMALVYDDGTREPYGDEQAYTLDSVRDEIEFIKEDPETFSGIVGVDYGSSWTNVFKTVIF